MNEDLRLFIADAKSKYGEVYAAEVEEDLYIFRLLTRREYKEILMIADTEDMVQEITCQVAVIYPSDMNFATGDAGLPGLLAPRIIEESGFSSQEKPQQYLEEYRYYMTTFEAQAEATIQAAFPHLTEEEIESWTVGRFMKTLAKAEWILQNIYNYPISFQTEQPDEEGEPEEEQEPPTYKELGQRMREEGYDPMIEYAPYILRPRPFAESPFVGGTDFWKKVY